MTKFQRKAWRKKCKEYASFLKDDFDFDYAYIVRLLAYKLQRTRKSLEAGYNANKSVLSKQIKEVESLLLKVDEYDYEENEMAAFNKKYGKPKMVECKLPGIGGGRGIEFIYDNGKPATAAMNRQRLAAHNRAFAKKKADLRKAFALMEENIWQWWD